MAIKEEIKEMNEDLIKRFLDAQAASSKALCEEIKNEIKVDIGSIRVKIDSMSDKQDALADEVKKDKDRTETRFKTLEEKMEEPQNQNSVSNRVTDEHTIQTAVQNYVDTASDSSWKASNLAREVFEHKHGLVVRGVRIDAKDDTTRKEAVKKFIKEDLKASEDLMNRIKIKEVVRLGTDNGAGKPPPLLIKFGHRTERNLLLPLSRNL